MLDGQLRVVIYNSKQTMANSVANRNKEKSKDKWINVKNEENYKNYKKYAIDRVRLLSLSKDVKNFLQYLVAIRKKISENR